MAEKKSDYSINKILWKEKKEILFPKDHLMIVLPIEWQKRKVNSKIKKEV